MKWIYSTNTHTLTYIYITYTYIKTYSWKSVPTPCHHVAITTPQNLSWAPRNSIIGRPYNYYKIHSLSYNTDPTHRRISEESEQVRNNASRILVFSKSGEGEGPL